MYFYDLNIGSPGGSHLGPWDRCLNNLVKYNQEMLHDFQALEPSRFEEEEF